MSEETKTPVTVDAMQTEAPATTVGAPKIPFMIGEALPIKGVWFTVAEVKPDGLLLKPQSFTGKRLKQLMRLVRGGKKD